MQESKDPAIPRKASRRGSEASNSPLSKMVSRRTSWGPGMAAVAPFAAPIGVEMIDLGELKLLKSPPVSPSSATSVHAMGSGVAFRSKLLGPRVKSMTFDPTSPLADRLIESSTKRHSVFEHDNDVLCCIVSRDSKWVVSGGLDKSLFIRDIDLGKVKVMKLPHLDMVQCCSLSSDNQWIAYGNGNVLTVHNLTTLEFVHSFDHDGEICDFTADNIAITCKKGKDLYIRYTATGITRQVFSQSARVKCFAFSGDNNSMAVSSGRAIILWDLTTGKERNRFDLDFEVECVAYSSDSKHVAVGGGKRLVVFNASTSDVKHTFEQDFLIKVCGFANGSTWIAYGGGKSIIVRNFETGIIKNAFEEHTSLNGFVISPDSRWLIVTGGRNVTLRSFVTCALRNTMQVKGLVMSRSKFVAFNDEDSNLVLRDIETGLTTHTVEVQKPVISYAVAANESWIALADGHRLVVRRLASRADAFELKAQHVDHCVFSPDNTLLAYSIEGKLITVDLALGRPVQDFECDGISCFTFTADSKYLIYGRGRWKKSTTGRSFFLRNIETGETTRSSDHTGNISCCDASPDGKWVIYGGGTSLVIREAVSWTVKHSIEHKLEVAFCTIASNSKWFASSDGPSLLLRDIESGAVLHVYIHDREISSCVISSSCEYIATMQKMSLETSSVTVTVRNIERESVKRRKFQFEEFSSYAMTEKFPLLQLAITDNIVTVTDKSSGFENKVVSHTYPAPIVQAFFDPYREWPQCPCPAVFVLTLDCILHLCVVIAEGVSLNFPLMKAVLPSKPSDNRGLRVSVDHFIFSNCALAENGGYYGVDVSLCIMDCMPHYVSFDTGFQACLRSMSINCAVAMRNRKALEICRWFYEDLFAVCQLRTIFGSSILSDGMAMEDAAPEAQALQYEELSRLLTTSLADAIVHHDPLLDRNPLEHMIFTNNFQSAKVLLKHLVVHANPALRESERMAAQLTAVLDDRRCKKPGLLGEVVSEIEKLIAEQSISIEIPAFVAKAPKKFDFSVVHNKESVLVEGSELTVADFHSSDSNSLFPIASQAKGYSKFNEVDALYSSIFLPALHQRPKDGVLADSLFHRVVASGDDRWLLSSTLTHVVRFKWRQYGKQLFRQQLCLVSMYILISIALVAIAVDRSAGDDSVTITSNPNNTDAWNKCISLSCLHDQGTGLDVSLLVLHPLYFMWSLYFAWRAFKQYRSSRFRNMLIFFRSSFWDVMDVGSVLVALSWFPMYMLCKSLFLERHILSAGMILNLFKYLSFMRGFKNFAALLGMLKQISIDMIPALGFLALFTVMFSFAFYALKGTVGEEVTDSLLRTVILVLNNFSIADFGSLTMKLLWGCFMVVVPIIVLNLIVSIMGNAFDKVQETMTREQLRNLSELLVDIELKMSKSALNKQSSFPRWLHVLGVKEGYESMDSDEIDFQSRVSRITSSVQEAVGSKLKEVFRVMEQLDTKLDTRMKDTHSRLDRADHRLREVDGRVEAWVRQSERAAGVLEAKVGDMMLASAAAANAATERVEGLQVKVAKLERSLEGIEDKIDLVLKALRVKFDKDEAGVRLTVV